MTTLLCYIGRFAAYVAYVIEPVKWPVKYGYLEAARQIERRRYTRQMEKIHIEGQTHGINR